VRIVTTDTSCKGHSANGIDNQPFTMAYVVATPPPPPFFFPFFFLPQFYGTSSVSFRYNSAEPNGYNDLTVSDSGHIHLITSKNHYQFNLAWMLQRAHPPPC
jgi:hypothetical protein